MSLLLSHLKTYDPKSAGQMKLSSTKLEHMTSTSEGASEVHEFVNGEIIKGQVIDIRSNLATIQLTDGSIVQGKLEQEVALYIGENATFEVEKGADQFIKLKFVPEGPNNPLAQMVEKALVQAGLPMNERNQEVVNELLKANLSVDKGNIQKFLRIAYQHPENDIKSLVFLAKNNIPVTQDNLQMLSDYQNNEHRVIAQLNTLANEMIEVWQSGCTDEIAMSLLEFATGAEQMVDASKMQQSEVPKETAERAEHTVKQSVQLEQIAKAENESVVDKSQTLPLRERYGEQARHMFADELESFGASKELATQIRKGTVTGKDVLNEVKQLLQDKGQPGERSQVLGKLMHRELMKSIVKEEIFKNHTLSPRQLSQKEQVKHFYQRLEEELDAMAKLLNKAEGGEAQSKLSGQSTHMKNHLEFMKTINQIYPYVQLPVKLKDKHIHSELYVYSNRKNGGNLKEASSVLLHLSMEHLGELDIHIRKNDKNLELKFYTETKEIKELFENTIEELNTVLHENGYQVKTEINQKVEEQNPFEQMLTQNENSSNYSVKRYSFDIRA